MHRGNVAKRMAIETAKALTNCCLLWQILDHSVVRHRCEVLLWNYAMLWRIVKWRCWGGEAVDTGTPAVACQWIICLRSTPHLHTSINEHFTYLTYSSKPQLHIGVHFTLTFYKLMFFPLGVFLFSPLCKHYFSENHKHSLNEPRTMWLEKEIPCM